ncbi:large ribosomal subunit protein mL38-like isoform X2 [Mytilus edulis]|uniref:large ribosomal subunit protein mL38-like isoform X2 n=1 Tax=Mytilus edulis TaxID=6550 RepID=UPI0039EE0ADD
MSQAMKRLKSFLQNVITVDRQQVRTKMYWPRKIEPEEEKTHAQRITEMKQTDPELDKVINIGFPVTKFDRTERKKIKHQLKESIAEKELDLERAARTRTLNVPLEEVKKIYTQEMQRFHWKSLAEHYGIYRDLFDNAMFYQCVNMDISYDFDEEYVSKVHIGNRLKPSEVKSKPYVEYTADPDTWWTIAMTAPDSHLQDNNMEYLHWLIGNIPGNDLNKGEELCNYLPPFPVHGTGYHRYVFVLYKQNRKIDFSKDRRPENCTSLQDRSFSTLEFYRSLQDDLTPASVNMFQSDWDESVRDTFWNILDMKEPRFEFKHPPPYHPLQKWYPHRQPFNLYLDRYRDIKDLNEEVLKDRLKDLKPFEPPPQQKYPVLNMIKYKQISGVQPTWRRPKLRHKYLKEMHWNDSEDKVI